ncbi:MULTISPECIES: hypothetical protein [Streptomyces]|uniref:Transposase n=1 Tax=Streptomyces dengpaensis TaxID=2049881 RepID=A0ABN5IAH6_9ACTN|nr:MULTISPECIES: hypothetical protein [Streptomyces]AVH59996.1 hypothetical protein C4B68_34160 [Streptomyces dengpaensis]PIB09634.1 hypothetical protein B1C81_10835 [Streptomyces sp. HG99]
MAGGPNPYKRKNPAEHAEKAAIVFQLKLDGHSFRAIEAITAAPNGPTNGVRIPWTTARDLLREELARRVDPKIDAYRTLHLARLEAELVRLSELEARAKQVLDRHHITVNNGRVISIDGEPLQDDGPVLAAIDRLIKIEDARRKNNESQRKLLGLDAPTKVDAQVTEVTQQDIELQEMLREAKAKVQIEEQRIIDGGNS